jgi:hypothetical protein
LNGIIAIAAGDYHSLALKADGTVVAWGNNGFGQSTVPSGLSGVIAIAGGRGHSLALRSDGTVVAWGADGYVPSGLSGVIAIAAGGDLSLALVANAVPLALSNSRWQNGVFTVSVPSQNGKTYGLQYKSALAESTWTLLPTTAGTGNILTLTDTSASSGQRFYRVSEQ